MKSILLSILLALTTNIASAAMIGDLQGDIWNIGANGHGDVSIGDQTTPVIITDFNRVIYTPSLTANTVLNATTIVVDSANGFIHDAHITIADPISGRYYSAHQIGVIAGLTVTLDTPLDHAFDYTTAEMAVGTHDLHSLAGTLASPIIYSVRAGEQTDIPVTIDITRIIITCTSANTSDFTNFCGIPNLINGLVLRRVDGTTSNIFNVKSNLELANIMFDFQIFAASIGQQGIDGFLGRLTFGGQNKMGVVVRLGPGEDLELLIQDNLTSLTTFDAKAEGHVVQPD